MNEKILIVEDEMIVATDLRILLERNHYTVTGIAANSANHACLQNEKTWNQKGF
jgi:DNA-binding NtrC family response regulator